MPFKALIVSLWVEAYGHLARFIVIASHSCSSFPAPLFTFCPGLLAYLPPLIAYRCRIRKRKLILEKQHGVSRTFQQFFLMSP